MARSNRFVWGIVGTGVVLTLVFGLRTVALHDSYDQYSSATLGEGKPRWDLEKLDALSCVVETMRWAEACPGIKSWCEATVPDVMRSCLRSQDRRAYCLSLDKTILSTRFGYSECQSLVDNSAEKYAKRAQKKYCALSFRAVAGYCAKIL